MKSQSIFRPALTIAVILVFSLVLAACNLPAKTEVPADPNLIKTLVYQTAVVQATEASVKTALAQMTKIAKNTATPPATVTAAALQPTQEPTKPPTPLATISATPTLVPSKTPVPPTATKTPQPCDSAKYVLDVNYEDGSKLAPGTAFTKTWRLKNTGTCTWTKDYAVVYTGGDLLSSTKKFSLPNAVAPGEQVEVSVKLTAPTKTGTYQSFFMLQNQEGKAFGIGDGSQAFWVKINVSETTVIFDLAKNYCAAEWRNGSASVPCPGTTGSDTGSVLKVDAPALENGSVENEPALRVEPQKIDNGVLTGKFPEFAVKNGDHFMTIIGCWDGMTNCKLTFKLQYQEGSGAVQTLATWNEAYDKTIVKVDIDLSSLAGKQVKFILYVSAVGAWNQSSGHWLLPRVVR